MAAKSGMTELMTINSVIPLKIITTNVMINCFFLSKERCLKRLNIGCIELFIKYLYFYKFFLINSKPDKLKTIKYKVNFS